jgi:DNA modification methylase
VPKVIREYNKLSSAIRSQLPDLNDLTGKEWSQLSRSINIYNGPIAEKRRLHGAAFPPSLAEHFIKIYTRKADWVLDPFMGVGTTGDVAEIFGRNFMGFEISRKFFQLARKGIDSVDARYFEYVKESKGLKTEKRLFNESCLNLCKYISPDTVTLTITSPPYGHLLKNIARSFAAYTYSKNIYKDKGRKLTSAYTNKAEDFGNQSLESYCDSVSELMKQLYLVTTPSGYNVWVVRDHREMTSHLPYINLHGKIIELAQKNSWVLSDIVMWDQTKQRHLVKLGGKRSRRFYFNIGHSFILAFRKNIPGEKFRNAF